MADVLQTLSVYYDESFVNSQEAGSLQTKQKKNHKLYIESKSSNKRYLVRIDKQNNQKYVLVNKNKVLLNSIKGQFKYVK